MYFSNLVLLTGLQSKSQSLRKESSKEDPKILLSSRPNFEVLILSFILNFEVSDQSFEVGGGGGGGGGTLEPF